MRLLERIPLRPTPAPAPYAAIDFAEGPELEDADLEQVVGGLERVYVPVPTAA